MTIPLNNSNSLVFLNKSRWHNELLKLEASPDIVLISQWEIDENYFQSIEPLVKQLVKLDCRYFVCAGKYSESLHDFIDDVILDMPLNDERKDSNNIMTTWHDTDSNEDVADFFLYSTGVSNSSLIGFLDEKNIEDYRLKNAILRKFIK